MDWKSCYQQQLDEIELFKCMFVGEDEFEVVEGESVVLCIETALESSEEPGEMSPLHIRISLKDLRIDEEIPTISVIFPASYPNIPAKVTAHSTELANRKVEHINETIDRLAMECIGEPSAFQFFEKAKDMLRDYTEAYLSEISMHGRGYGCDDEVSNTTGGADNSNSNETKSDQQDRTGTANSSPEPVVLGRRAIYFHHIIAATKQKLTCEWAAELGLGGYSKIGWPGVIIVEGRETDCKLYVRRLQHLRWKQMVVRGEQIEQAQYGESIDELRKLHRAFQQLPENGMSTLATLCREAGLEELFLTVMKIYNRSAKK